MFDEYTLLINWGEGNKHYEVLSTSEELKRAVSEYLTKSEIKSGVLERLTTFNPKHQKDGYVENRWRNFSTCAYLKGM